MYNYICLQAYLREGVALEHLNRDGDSLAAYAGGLAKEPHNASLLQSLLTAALKSPLKG